MDHTGEPVQRADGERTRRAVTDTERTITDGGRTGDGPLDGDEEYVCEACGRTFPTEAALEDHVLEQGIVD